MHAKLAEIISQKKMGHRLRKSGGTRKNGKSVVTKRGGINSPLKKVPPDAGVESTRG